MTEMEEEGEGGLVDVAKEPNEALGVRVRVSNKINFSLYILHLDLRL